MPGQERNPIIPTFPYNWSTPYAPHHGNVPPTVPFYPYTQGPDDYPFLHSNYPFHGNAVFHHGNIQFHGNAVPHRGNAVSHHGSPIPHNGNIPFHGNADSHRGNIPFYGNADLHRGNISFYGNADFQGGNIPFYGNVDPHHIPFYRNFGDYWNGAPYSHVGDEVYYWEGERVERTPMVDAEELELMMDNFSRQMMMMENRLAGNNFKK